MLLSLPTLAVVEFSPPPSFTGQEFIDAARKVHLSSHLIGRGMFNQYLVSGTVLNRPDVAMTVVLVRDPFDDSPTVALLDPNETYGGEQAQWALATTHLPFDLWGQTSYAPRSGPSADAEAVVATVRERARQLSEICREPVFNS
jgi:hypothetical protein